jgi:hypothetical protein
VLAVCEVPVREVGQKEMVVREVEGGGGSARQVARCGGAPVLLSSSSPRSSNCLRMADGMSDGEEAGEWTHAQPPPGFTHASSKMTRSSISKCLT